MATNFLNKKLESSLYITKTKTTGDQRIKDALDNNEECAILSTFLPPGFEPETKNMFFECALKHKCFLGNSKLKTPGNRVCLRKKSACVLGKLTPTRICFKFVVNLNYLLI
jgi:hypothetical protein